MTDERMSDILRVVGHSAEPDQAFLERLYDDLAVELGFRPTTETPVRPRRVRPRRSRSWWLLAAAAMLTLLGGSALIAGAAVRLLQEQRPPDVLDAIRASGTMAILVRDGFPQARSPVGSTRAAMQGRLRSTSGPSTSSCRPIRRSRRSLGSMAQRSAWWRAASARPG